MVDQSVKEVVQGLFRSKDFESLWFIIKEQYKELGFSDVLSDQERIDEYKWITHQLRKYMFGKQDDIMSCNSVDEMIAKVEILIGKADEYGDERKKVVYNFMRDHWLYEVRNSLVYILQTLEEENDEFAEEVE